MVRGAIDSTFTLNNVQPADSGDFSVVVYNEWGALESRVAQVRVEAPALPFADDFANRGTITGAIGGGTGTNLRAKSEGLEPRHADQRGGESVWISWTAPAKGIVTFSTVGSSFDTLLAVYQSGSSLKDGLAAVAQDDDSGGYHTSLVQFNAMPGQTYEIAVDGMEKAEGDIVLNWNLLVTDAVLPTVLKAPRHQTLNIGETLNLSVELAEPAPYKFQWYVNDPATTTAVGMAGTVRSAFTPPHTEPTTWWSTGCMAPRARCTSTIT
jgi:hypothetical protein